MAKMKIPSIAASEITPERIWRSRRRWMQGVGAGAIAAGAGALLPARADNAASGLRGAPNPDYFVPEKLTSERDVATYNNFYEFGTGKNDPSDHGASMKTRPWTVTIEGEVERPRTFDIDELLKLAAIEERVYRLRCVEAWSMVIPWEGYPLSVLLKKVQPTSKARYIEFVTALQPENMPGASAGILDWPYVEALRMDEAMHPLTMLVMGVYGKPLPNQNGAPVRVVIPWKYGFKSGKSIVKIRLVDEMPLTSWNKAAPHEYGFYANVNPDVAHPRWSQATERRIGGNLFTPRAKTLMFNGYADQVASLYTGMDLQRYY